MFSSHLLFPLSFWSHFSSCFASFLTNSVYFPLILVLLIYFLCFFSLFFARLLLSSLPISLSALLISHCLVSHFILSFLILVLTLVPISFPLTHPYFSVCYYLMSMSFFSSIHIYFHLFILSLYFCFSVLSS